MCLSAIFHLPRVRPAPQGLLAQPGFPSNLLSRLNHIDWERVKVKFESQFCLLGSTFLPTRGLGWVCARENPKRCKTDIIMFFLSFVVFLSFCLFVHSYHQNDFYTQHRKCMKIFPVQVHLMFLSFSRNFFTKSKNFKNFKKCTNTHVDLAANFPDSWSFDFVSFWKKPDTSIQ